MPLYSASFFFFFWLRLFSFSDRCSLFYHLSMHETKTKLNIYHQSQKIQHSPSATINLKQRRSPLSPASFLARLFSPQQEVSTLWFSFLVVVFFFPPLGGYSKNMVVVIWRYSKTSLKYSSPGPNVFLHQPWRHSVLWHSSLSLPLPLPPNTHAHSHLPGCLQCWSNYKCLRQSKDTEVNTSVLGIIPESTHTNFQAPPQQIIFSCV